MQNGWKRHGAHMMKNAEKRNSLYAYSLSAETPEFKHLIKIFHRDEKHIGVQTVPPARLDILTGYKQPVAQIPRAHASGAHGDKVLPYVSGFYACLMEQAHHHVIVCGNLVIKRISAMRLVDAFAHIE